MKASTSRETDRGRGPDRGHDRVRASRAARRHRAATLALALVAAGLPGAVAPEPVTLPTAAVGRISYGTGFIEGSAICTGALVAADLVLTAAHCVARAAAVPGTITFAAGASGDTAAALRRGAEVIVQSGDPGAARVLADDVALLRLDRPIPADVATPLPLAAPEADVFTLLAYRRDAPGQARRDDGCSLIATDGPVIGLTCAVVSGNSGAPVLLRTEAGWRIAAVAVAQGAVPVRAWAVVPGTALRARIAAAF